MQTLAAQLGGSTEAADQREFGHAQVERIGEDRLLGGLSDHPGHARLDVWMSHGDHVVSAPPGFVVTARTERIRSEEHTSELQPLMRLPYAVFCLKKKKHDS